MRAGTPHDVRILINGPEYSKADANALSRTKVPLRTRLVARMTARQRTVARNLKNQTGGKRKEAYESALGFRLRG